MRLLRGYEGFGSGPLVLYKRSPAGAAVCCIRGTCVYEALEFFPLRIRPYDMSFVFASFLLPLNARADVVIALSVDGLCFFLCISDLLRPLLFLTILNAHAYQVSFQ